VGFESSHVARRRLAAAAMSNQRVQEALALFTPAAEPQPAPADLAHVDVPRADAGLANTLETLAVDIVDTPGAGGALLLSFAEQVRALRLVAEALDRMPDAPLPPAIGQAVRSALAQATFTPPLALDAAV
jgi:hypothetical protein